MPQTEQILFDLPLKGQKEVFKRKENLSLNALNH